MFLSAFLDADFVLLCLLHGKAGYQKIFTCCVFFCSGIDEQADGSHSAGCYDSSGLLAAEAIRVSKRQFAFMAVEGKIPFFVLSIIVAIVTLYSPANPSPNLFPLDVRVANAIVSFVFYLERPSGLMIWPFSILSRPKLWPFKS